MLTLMLIIVLQWKSVKKDDLMDSKLKCVFEEGTADASPKVCHICVICIPKICTCHISKCLDLGPVYTERFCGI